MPTNRFGYSDDFVLNNGNVGINSAIPQEKLDVVGTIRADNVKVSGASNFTTYEGFLNADQNILESISLEAGQGITGSLSGEIIVGTGATVTGIGSATSGQGYIESLKVYNTFTVPVGGTLDRPSKANPGQLYYNKDFSSIEFYDGDRWRQVDNTTQRGRGVFSAGNPTTISYINISSTGNAINFGNLTGTTAANTSSCSSSTRGIFGGGSYVNTITYITIASEGNSISFGTLSTATRGYLAACSSSTRGLFGGGYTNSPAGATVNVIDYIQFSTLGNALDFGDLFTGRYVPGSFSSPTRGIWGGGVGVGPTYSLQKSIEFVTISSTGNAINFGDLTQTKAQNSGCSNSTRGLFMGGSLLAGSSLINTIDYITIASTGNSLTFGDLTQARGRGGCCSTSSRGVLGGGRTPSIVNTIDYVTIATTGNAQDFGDLTESQSGIGGCSDSHGGLGGF